MNSKKCIIFLIGIFIIIAFGCQQMQNQMMVEPDDDKVVNQTDNQPDQVPVYGNVIIGDTDAKFGTDEYKLNSAEITDDILKINVSYSGGCEKHIFTLISSDQFLESFPVQLKCVLQHNAMKDTCEAWITQDYHFNLTPIKTMYQKAYQQEAGTIILRLKDAPNIDLVYEFTM